MTISVKHVLHSDNIWISVQTRNHNFYSSENLTINFRKTIQVINLIFSGMETICLRFSKPLFTFVLTYMYLNISYFLKGISVAFIFFLGGGTRK